MAPEPVERRLAAILSADVVGYSRLMAADESATIRSLGDHLETISLLVRQHRGRVVDAPGDNLLAEFPSAIDAAQGAVEIQRVMGARNADVGSERRMEFRIGVHLGDVVVGGERIYGDGVNIAARLEGLAEAGGICMSEAVRSQVESKLDLRFEDLGERSLKNIPQPLRAWRLRPDAEPRGTDVDQDVQGFSGRPAIAVMAFDNMSGDPDQEYFADGISEDLITRLSLWRSFPVIARNSSFVYKGKASDLKQVSRELGARYIVEGSVRKVGDRVRITAQAIDATSGHHVWSERYDRQLDDIFALQDEITEAIVATLYSELFYAELKRAGGREPASLDAWECAHRGSFHLFEFTKAGNATARVFYQKATELDPQMLDGFFGLAMSHHLDIIYQWTTSPGETIAELSRAAENAIKQNYEDGRGQLALGLAYSLTGQQEKMLEAFQTAIELNPSAIFAHFWLGTYLALAGKAEEAIVHLERALRLSPHDPMRWGIFVGLALAHFGACRYQQAVECAEKSRQLRPDQSVTLRALATSLAHLGRIEEARAAFQEMRRLQPEFSMAIVKLIFSNSPDDYIDRYVEGLRLAGWEE